MGDSFYCIRIDVNGKYEWVIGLVVLLVCFVDVINFLFDSYLCEFIFILWGIISLEVMLLFNVIIVDWIYYLENVEWIFVFLFIIFNIENNVLYLIIIIDLKRNLGYFFVNLIMLIIVVVLFNILVFLLLLECGERVGYVVIIFLIFVVYLDIIMVILFKFIDFIVKLLNYFILMVIFGVLISLMIIVLLNVYYRDEEVLIFLWLVKLLICLYCKCGKGEIKLVFVVLFWVLSLNFKLKNMISFRVINIGIGLWCNFFEVEL